MGLFSSCGASVGFLTRYDGEIREPLVQRQRSQASMRVARQIASLLSSHEDKDHDIWSHQFMANRWGNNGTRDRLFSWASKSLWMLTAAMKLKDTCSWEEKI